MRKRVAVLRGGPSSEFSVSMASGQKVVEALQREGYLVKDIVITRAGEWLLAGRPVSVDQTLPSTDVFFLALHGQYGEDGQIQRLLQSHSVPFTGSSAFSSALAFNKALAKKTVSSYGLLTPASALVDRDTLADSLYRLAANIKSSFGPEYVVKPVDSGSSIGVRLVTLGQSLSDAIGAALLEYPKVLVEEYIRGREATVAVIEQYRNEQHYVFPAIEIIPPVDNSFFDYDAKYSGKTAEVCPGNFSYREKGALAEAAVVAHTALDLSQISRSDFILRDGEVYYLETNTIPGLTKESLLPKAAAAVGLSYPGLITHLVETAA